MEALLKIARHKLDLLQYPFNPELATIPQLILAVFNEETPDDLDLDIYDRNDMEQEVIAPMDYSDKAVQVMLGLRDTERAEDITRMLSRANTVKEIRQVMIMDLLFEAISIY
jgi:hypothetical protein